MHPLREVLMLKVKDWKLDTIQAQRIERALSEVGIAFASNQSAKGRGALYGSEDAVKIVSMLEFDLVLIPSLGDMPKMGEDEAGEARVLYVAMTRAIDRLVMTYREPSSFTRKIQDSIGVRQHLDEMDSQKAAG